MSKFTDSLKVRAVPSRTVPPTRQGRKHVDVYVLPGRGASGFAYWPPSSPPPRISPSRKG